MKKNRGEFIDKMNIQEKLLFLSSLRGSVVDDLDELCAKSTYKYKQRDRDMMYFRWIEWNSLEKTAQKFSVTRERIRQIEAKVMEQLRTLKNN